MGDEDVITCARSSDRLGRRYFHGGDGEPITTLPRHAVCRLRCSSSSRPGLVRWTRGSLELAWPICIHRALGHRSTASLRGLGWLGCRFSLGANSVAN